MKITSNAKPVRRNRVNYALMAVLVVGAGLLWRSSLLQLPAFASKHGGGLLWAVLVFLMFAFLFHRASTLRVALLSLAFPWGVEFSQIYHADWIDWIRSTRIGALALGLTFHPPDLLAYALGIAGGASCECLLSRMRGRTKNDA